MLNKCIDNVKNLSSRIGTAVMGLLLMFGSGVASAQDASGSLPTLEAPSRGEGDGLINTLQNYAFDFGILVGLIIATVAFLVVANASVATFNEARIRGEWSKFSVVIVVGVVLIVCIIWLATKAGEIL